MEVLRLRKMTLKSVIGIGSNKYQTVQSLMNGECYGALISLYYGLSKISYVEEMLEMLAITKDHQIEKPGRIENYAKRKGAIKKAVRRLWKKKNEIKPHNLSENAIMGIASHLKKVRRDTLSRRESTRYLTAKDMQTYNHGHRNK